VREPARSEQDPDPRVFARLADAYRKEGLLDEAIQICRDGLAAHPGSAGGRAVLAQALLERGALDEAEQEFRRVLEQAPEHLPALRFLGDVSAGRGRADEARRYYERVLRLNPGDSETQDRLAALPVTQEAGASEESVPAPGWNRDPLASPTLAALYAAQGHPDVAEVIYAQLGRRPGEAGSAATSGDILGLGQAAPGSPVLEKLLSLREAARKVREAGRPDAGGNASHDP
jgi:tetratricopeptide (TPR) repeat protein